MVLPSPRVIYSTPVSLSCLTDDDLRLLLERRIAPDHRERIDEHLDRCAACRTLLAGAAQVASDPVSPAPPEPAGVLPSGKRLGPYQIEALVGVGGMGQVYRAFDERLNRGVALKTLPEKYLRDARRRARFETEAVAIARLNHPNICTVYDVGQSEGVDYLVMEWLEGETLSAHLRAHTKGVSISQALAWSAHILAGLDAAHRAGIVHRDLKPANIMVTRQGLKLLDFGLAKLIQPSLSQDVSHVTGQATKVEPTGKLEIVGTLPYMSPEQLEGKPVDHRTDIYAFGVLLYQLLSGRLPFDQGSDARTIAAILHETPIVPSKVNPHVPAALDTLVMECLAREPAERWQSAQDLRRALSRVATQPPPAPPPRRIWPALATLAGLSAIIGGVLLRSPAPPKRTQPTRVHFTVNVKAMPWSGAFAVSPNGHMLAFIDESETRPSVSQIKLRRFDDATTHAVEGTEGAVDLFWSPQGETIAFATQKRLQTLDLDSRKIATIATLAAAFRGGAWGPDGRIVFFTADGASYQLSGRGGSAEALFPERRRRSEPTISADGKLIIYRTDRELTVGLPNGIEKTIAQDVVRPQYTLDGALWFVRHRTAVRGALDTSAWQLSQTDERMVEDVTMPSSGTAFSVARNATALAYRRGTHPKVTLRWYDESGTPGAQAGEPAPIQNFALHPDGQRIAVRVLETDMPSRLYVIDPSRGVQTETGIRNEPDDGRWSHDGLELAYVARAPKAHRVEAAAISDGATRVLFEHADGELSLEDWSSDGRYLALGFRPWKGGNKAAWVVDLQNANTPLPFGVGADYLDEFVFSPDTRWLAYGAVHDQRWEVFLTTNPPSDARWQLSSQGGVQPRWDPRGDRIYYLDPEGVMMHVSLGSGPTPAPTAPKRLMASPIGRPSSNIDEYEVAPGPRFLFKTTDDPQHKRPIHVVTGLAAAPVP